MDPEREMNDGNAPEPADVLRELSAEWREEAAKWERLASQAENAENVRQHRGKQEVLQQGIRRLESRDIEDDTLGAVGYTLSRTLDRSQEISRLIGERAPLESKHRAMKEMMNRMVNQLAEARARIEERLDEDELPDPRDWTWVNDEVRDRLLQEWGYED